MRGDIERRKMKEVVYVSSEEEGESDDDCLFVENPIVSAQRKIKFEPDLIINFEKPILQDFQFYPVFTHNLLNKQYYNYLRRNISEVPVAVRRKYQFEIENAASLLPDQIVTKKRYLKNGHSWSRQQFDIYLDLLEETGRNKITSKNIPFKTPEEVQRFHNHFWNHYESIKCSRVKEVVNTVMLNENKRSLAWIMSKYENPLEEMKITGPSNYPVDADRFMLYRMHELSQDPKNEENIPEKILQEMKNNEKFSELMVEKNEFDIINHCEALIQSVKQGMKDLMVMENPKDIMQANAKLSTRTQFIGKYKKPVLHEMQFFPQRLHELVEMEHYTYNRVSI